MTHTPLDIAIIGAGPIGLEAAVRAMSDGHHVTVYEAGRIAENVQSWGHIRLFSPFQLNSSARGRQAISESKAQSTLPSAEDLLTGQEYAERYLIPLSELQELRDHIQERSRVLSISRSRSWKGDAIGKPQRGDDPFQLLIQSGDAQHSQRVDRADVVFDCSGVYPNHNWIGSGGMPCPGERELLRDAHYRLADITGVDRDWYAGKTTLVVGGGYSAATAVVALAELHRIDPQTKIIWVTRTPRETPIPQIENDTLTERDELAATANRLASKPDSPVTWLGERIIRKVSAHSPGPSRHVTLENRKGDLESFFVDQIIANVGYRPDRALYEELQIHECYASQGPIKLAAALLGETSSDCLAQGSHGCDTLKNPEPNFFILGAKSYGRDSRFLIKIGLEQIEDVFDMIALERRSAMESAP